MLIPHNWMRVNEIKSHEMLFIIPLIIKLQVFVDFSVLFFNSPIEKKKEKTNLQKFCQALLYFD